MTRRSIKTTEHAIHQLEVARDTLEHALREVFQSYSRDGAPEKADTSLEGYGTAIGALEAWKHMQAKTQPSSLGRHEVKNLMTSPLLIVDLIAIRIRNEGITDLKQGPAGAKLLAKFATDNENRFETSEQFKGDAGDQQRKMAKVEAEIMIEILATLLGIKEQYRTEKRNIAIDSKTRRP